ncbi:lectin BRA-3-like [Saccostrea cucullata]|uniref:lectin BRA-3-like n=1 Tax=Saccostrea cuccullata TaxID=36930 RepID=UPI002ED47402
MKISKSLIVLGCILFATFGSCCQYGGKTYRNHCYMYFSQKVNWFEAQMLCRQRGGYLVHIDNYWENNWLAKQYRDYRWIWIDATDIAREGHWRSWYTGKAVFTNWSRGNPNNAGKIQHCATLNWGGVGLWDDDYCFKGHPFICEAQKTEC